MKKILSIIIPHYESITQLSELVDSIPDIKEIEILIIDDKSISPPREDHFKNKNLKVLHNTTDNKNAGTCRNIGISYASGEWLLFADSDDFFLPLAFEHIDAEIVNTTISTDIIFFPPTSIKIPSKTKSSRHEFFEGLVHAHKREKSERIRYQYSSPCSKLIRKSLILENNILFDEIIAANDVIFSLKSGHSAKKIYSSIKRIYCITESAGSLTKTKSKNIRRARLATTIKYNQLLSDIGKIKYQEPLLNILVEFRDVMNLSDQLKLSAIHIFKQWKITNKDLYKFK